MCKRGVEGNGSEDPERGGRILLERPEGVGRGIQVVVDAGGEEMLMLVL